MKKFLALALVLVMVFALFTACSSEKKKDDGGTPSTKPSTNVPDGGDDVDPDEIVTIEFWMMDNGNTGSGSKVKDVEDAINAITEAEIGVHVNFTWVQTADLGTQLMLAIANQEVVDLTVYVPPATGSFLTFYTSGATLDITDLIEEYGQDLKALFGEELLNMTTIDGRLHGISTYRVLNSNMYLCMRADVLREAGVYDLAAGMTSWSEWESVMQAIVDSGQPITPIGNAGGEGLYGDAGALYGIGDEFSSTITMDILGDSIYMVYTDQSGNVSLLPEHEGYVAQCKMAKEWADAGYLWSDTAFSRDGSESMISASVFSSYIVQSEYGVEVNKSQTCATEMLCVELGKSYLSTTQGQKFGCFIPVCSAEPEAAMKFINLIYTSSDLMNLIHWGVEGLTYEVVDGQAQYIGDADASTSGYHGMDFSFGNQYKALPWKGAGATFREDSYADFAAAPKSVYMGLTVETSDYQTLLAALIAVKDEFHAQLTSGLYSDATYNEYLSKLNAAGAGDWIAIYQTAVDDFMK